MAEHGGNLAIAASSSALRPAEHPGHRRLADRVRVDHEAGERCGRALRHVELRDVERVEREDVTVRLVALGRARAAVARDAVVGGDARGTARQRRAVGVACALRELRRCCRDVIDDPVPPSRAAGGRVGVVHQEREALRVGRCAGPAQRRRNVLSRAAEAVERLLRLQRSARREIGTRERERTGKRLGGKPLRREARQRTNERVGDHGKSPVEWTGTIIVPRSAVHGRRGACNAQSGGGRRIAYISDSGTACHLAGGDGQLMTAPATRVEHDLLGDRAVPADAYYGVHTLRAVENFPITGNPISIYPDLIRALACIKEAAALANQELGLLDAEKADAIVKACEEIRAGRLHDQFVVDVIQGGAGTSTNMNANEVIANLALEHMGHRKGEYRYLHPNEHVNMSQSTNDVYPSSLKVSTYFGIFRLVDAMATLRHAFEVKAEEFRDVLKMGRTQLQDAVPMTLGQEFTTYAVMLGEDEERLKEAATLIREINLGATAIGTGINAPPGYAELVCRRLSALTGIPLITAPNLIEATQDCGAFAQLSGVLKRVAVKLSKTCNDLRLLSSGPRAGLNEINLPAVQAGSSIMPGKVNPVIPEVVNQIAFEVIGNDITVSFAAEAGQLQLNAFEPIIAHSLFKSLYHLAAGCRTLTDRCVNGISANRERAHRLLDESTALVTALNPYIGYANATQIAQEALASGRRVYDLVLERKLLSKERLDELLQPAVLTHPRPILHREAE